MGEKSTEAKREIDETRAHLAETLDAIQLKARRNLDIRYQLAHNQVLQVGIGLAIFALVGGGVFITWRQSKRTPAQRLARRLKLGELRERLTDFGEDAQAWAVAQKRILQDDNKSAATATAVPHKESALRRIGVSAAEAAFATLATGLARRLMDRSKTPHDDAHPTAVMSRHR